MDISILFMYVVYPTISFFVGVAISMGMNFLLDLFVLENKDK